MNDPLTTLLQAQSDQVRTTLPSAAGLRRSAERGRRNRRIAGGVITGLVLTIVLATGRDGLTKLAPRPGPVSTPTPTATVLATDPLMTDADWALLTRGSGLDQLTTRTGDAVTSISECLSSPWGWPADESVASTYREQRPSTTVFQEYVLRFRTTEAAHQAVVDAHSTFSACPAPAEVIAEVPDATSAIGVSLLDEMFAGQRATFATARHLGEPVSLYALRVARHGSIVVVIEDLGAPDDRAQVLLTAAMQRALGRG